MNILITGGSGFIGSHCALELWENYHQVTIVDNYSNSSSDVKTKISQLTNNKVVFFEGDIRNTNLISEILHARKIELVIHLAGYKSIKDSFENPSLYYEINVEGTKSLINTMNECFVKNLVFSSSATVYGNPTSLPIYENYDINPIHPYGKNKAEIEFYLRDISKNDPMWRIINFRYFNPVGAHNSLEIGENMFSAPNNLVPFILKVLLKEEDVLEVFGKDYETHDGTCIRDYVHIVDIAKAHTKVINSFNKLENGFHAFNLGSGKGFSVIEIIREFEKVAKKNIPYKFSGRRDGDVPSLYADISKAKKKLEWQPEYTLEEMCISAYQFALKSVVR
jgi:UDP-glucose 4-epimerase